jgi:hypothetical protein
MRWFTGKRREYKQKAGISQEGCDEVKQWKYDDDENAD